MTQDGISFDTKRHVKILVIWLVITVLSAVTIIALFVTLPVLAALLAELFVRPRTKASAPLAWALGPMLMTGAGWFLLRVDEVPGEGPPSAGLTVWWQSSAWFCCGATT